MRTEKSSPDLLSSLLHFSRLVAPRALAVHHAIEARARDARELGGFRDDAAGALEHRGDVRVLEAFENFLARRVIVELRELLERREAAADAACAGAEERV